MNAPRARSLGLLLSVTTALAAEQLPNDPVSSRHIELTSSGVVDTPNGSYDYDVFVNYAYPCTRSGYATFMTAKRTDDLLVDDAPMLVYLDGQNGGFYWTPTGGEPRYTPAGQEHHGDQVDEGEFLASFTSKELTRRLLAHEGDHGPFRFLSLGYCHHDYHMGLGKESESNPNPPACAAGSSDGGEACTVAGHAGGMEPRRASGALANMAAVRYLLHEDNPVSRTTSSVIVYGVASGAFGAGALAKLVHENVGPGLVDGVVLDSALNAYYGWYSLLPPYAPPECDFTVYDHPEFVDELRSKLGFFGEDRNTDEWTMGAGEPLGETPLFVIWPREDQVACFDTPIELHETYVDPWGGRHDVLPGTEVRFRPVSDQVVASHQARGVRSRYLQTCVDDPRKTPYLCDLRVPTAEAHVDAGDHDRLVWGEPDPLGTGGVLDPDTYAGDYVGEIVDWVSCRMGESSCPEE